MRTRLIPMEDLAEGEIARWRELAERAVEPNPFFEPEFILAVWRVQAEAVAIAVVEDGTEWLACLPVHAGRDWRRIPLKALASWTNLYGYLGTPLVQAGREEPAVASLVGLLRKSTPSFVGLDLLGAEGPVFEALESLGHASPSNRYAEFERAVLEHGREGGYLGINRKHQRDQARMRRRMQEELGAEVATIDRAGEDAAVDRFLAIEASGWKGGGGAFASVPGHTEIFREICRGFSSVGRLQLLSLESSERAVAMKCNIVAGEWLFCFKIAFDDELARFSPGIQLELDNIENFDRSNDLAWMDSCAEPGNRMINRLWPDRRRITALAVSGPGLRGRVSQLAVRGASQARSWLRD